MRPRTRAARLSSSSPRWSKPTGAARSARKVEPASATATIAPSSVAGGRQAGARQPRGQQGAQCRDHHQRRDHRQRLGLHVDRREQPRGRVHEHGRGPHGHQPEVAAPDRRQAADRRRQQPQRHRRVGAVDLASDDLEVPLRPDPEGLAREDRRVEPAGGLLDLRRPCPRSRRAGRRRAPPRRPRPPPRRRSPCGGGGPRRAARRRRCAASRCRARAPARSGPRSRTRPGRAGCRRRRSRRVNRISATSIARRG